MKLEYSSVVETVIEITKLYTWFKLNWEVKGFEFFNKDYTAADHEIFDWASEFESRVGYTYDWEDSEYDYIQILDDFVTKKICDACGVPEDMRPKQNTDVDFDKPGRWF